MHSGELDISRAQGLLCCRSSVSALLVHNFFPEGRARLPFATSSTELQEDEKERERRSSKCGRCAHSSLRDAHLERFRGTSSSFPSPHSLCASTFRDEAPWPSPELKTSLRVFHALFPTCIFAVDLLADGTGPMSREAARRPIFPGSAKISHARGSRCWGVERRRQAGASPRQRSPTLGAQSQNVTPLAALYKRGAALRSLPAP